MTDNLMSAKNLEDKVDFLVKRIKNDNSNGVSFELPFGKINDIDYNICVELKPKLTPIMLMGNVPGIYVSESQIEEIIKLLKQK